MPPEPTISVIVPALNEARNLPHVLPHIPGHVLEVLLVDGSSTDDTVAVAIELMPSIRVVQQEGRGKGAALRTGFSAARGDIIVMLDADGSTDPREIPAFVHALTVGGADFVKGSRFMRGGGTADMPLHRRLGNGAFVLMVRLLFGGGYTDLCYGYSAFWRRVVPLLGLDADGFEIETMMNVRALKVGLKVAEVPSFEAPRVHGVGRLRTIPDGSRVLRTIVRERFNGTPRLAENLPVRDSDVAAGAAQPLTVAVPIEVRGNGRGMSEGALTWGPNSFSEPASMDLGSNEAMIAR
jgi:glycosyltransferase involved in cell wall biosynthesis